MNPLKFEKPLIMAHRGFQTQYPENTMVSFMAAVRVGAQFLELDVTFTRDRQIVVIHDPTVDRTTNGVGSVHSYSLNELRQLDAGSWFHPRFAGEQIPTLDEVLEQFAGKVYLNLEIKSHDHTFRERPDQTEQAVVKLVGKKNKQAFVLISSFDPVVLKNVKRLNPAINVAFISKQFRSGETVALCKELEVFSYHPNLEYLEVEQVKTMHRDEIHVFPYNINNAADIYRAFALGIDGLIAKDPHLVRQCYFESLNGTQNGVMT